MHVPAQIVGEAQPLQLLRALFETSPVGIGFYDRELRYLDVNDAFAQFDGRSPREHIGKSVTEILQGQSSQIVPLLRTVFASGKAVTGIELLGARNPAFADRNTRWLASYHPVRQDGQVVAVLAMVSDVTETRRAESVLMTQKELLERCVHGETLETMLERITWTIIDCATEEMIPSILLLDGTTLRHGAAPTLPAEYVAAIDGTVIGPGTGSCGTAAYLNTAIYVSDIATDPRWAPYRHLALPHGLRACWSTPIRGANGQVLGTFALYHRQAKLPSKDDLALIELFSRTTAVLIEWQRGDEARQKNLEAEQAARRSAEDAGRAKDEFLAILSHELRTPLNAILGWARMLRLRPEDQDTADRALTAIERNAESQARLVEDLLDMARIVTGKLNLNIEPIEIAAVAEAALDTVRPAADAKGVQLTARLDAGRLPAQGDAARLQQVVWNLLTNAVKFTPSGGHVELLASSSNGLITICVQDDGEGIGPELLPHIFDRYRQGQNPVSGLGLGLAIAREVIELHGGSLVAHSDGVGRGARFEMRLPAAALALA